jgi:hypothetical protein
VIVTWDDGDDDPGMGYDENIDNKETHLLKSPLISHGANVGDSSSWPGDVGYDQNMSDPLAMDQDGDARALWQSHGTAHYRTVADRGPCLQVPGFHRRSNHHMIPFNIDAIVNHYDTSHRPK